MTGTPYPPPFDPSDPRYGVALEWCGHPDGRRWVARWRGGPGHVWIGQAGTRAEAVALCERHHVARWAPAEAVGA